MSFFRMGVCLMFALLAYVAPAMCADAINFKGKTISMVVGSETGGGTDATGRLVAPFFEKYLPGNPVIVIRNMPGAQGVTALNYIIQQTKPDGLTLITGSNVQVSPLTYRKANAIYDPVKFAYVGGVGRGGAVVMINVESEKRLHDKSQAPLFFGMLDGTRAIEQVSIWGAEFLGWNIKVVTGYRGTSAVMLALERGEVDMASTGNMFQIKNLVEGGKFKIVSQSGALENGKFISRPDFPDVPVFGDEIHEQLRDPVAKQAFDYWLSINALDKWVGLAPGTPSDMVEVYRAAFRKMIADPEFLTLGNKISEDLTPMSYRDVEVLVGQLAGATPEAEEFMRELQRKQGIRVQ
jgi:tripartite-type tricarboxylate transporter receptor subunit TctC